MKVGMAHYVNGNSPNEEGSPLVPIRVQVTAIGECVRVADGDEVVVAVGDPGDQRHRGPAVVGRRVADGRRQGNALPVMREGKMIRLDA
jgi:hypothetical protein